MTTLEPTPRELEVLTLWARGLATSEIGKRLYLSPRTVEQHDERRELHRRIDELRARVAPVPREQQMRIADRRLLRKLDL